MAEQFSILCGEAAPDQCGEGVIRLDVDGAEGTAERVNLKVDHISCKMVATVPGRLVDLLEIAAYVYAADQLVTRGGPKMRGMGQAWRRTLDFSIPVRDVAFWQCPEVRDCLIQTLSFLSDDYYEFQFMGATNPRRIDERLDLSGEGAPRGFSPDHVILFSGGLDSLAGAASLLQSDEKVALISHHASSAIQARQRDLVEELRRRAPPGHVFHVPVRVTRGLDPPRSFTQRTRSFLFASLAMVVARLFDQSRAVFFENGVVSVNLPIAEHVVGSRATRTTHPKVLADYSRLFSLIAETEFTVANPYFWDTKAEVLRRLADAGAADLIGRSFSCSHVRLSVAKGQQCGICTQCLDRRFGVLTARLEEHDPQDGYAVDLLTGARTDPQEAAVAESFVLSATRYPEMSDTAFFARYGGLLRVLRHLPGDMNENAARLFELHRRHGLGVRNVVDGALGRLSSLSSVSSLPPTCLLSLMRSSFGTPALRVVDPTETEPPVAKQATVRDVPTIPRPLVVCLAHEIRKVIIADDVELGASAYSLLCELVDRRLGDLSARRSTDEFEFLPTRRLAASLNIDESALRKRIARVRKDIRDGFERAFRIQPTNDEVIESVKWSGYRLNAYTQIGSVPHIGARDLGDVTTLARVSRHPKKDDGNQSSHGG